MTPGAMTNAAAEVADDPISTPEVCARAGVTYRQLDYWARSGVIEPILTAQGSGTRRRWLTSQVRLVRVLGALSRLGADSSVMTPIARQLERRPAWDWRGHVVVTAAGDVSDLLDVEACEGYVVNLAECAREPVPTEVR